MSQTKNKKLTPNLDQQSTKVLNLTVLQRIDPFIDEILFTAAHVSFYDFNIETNQWVRSFLSFLYFFLFTSILLSFLSQLSSQPFYRVARMLKDLSLLLRGNLTTTLLYAFIYTPDL